MSRSSVIFCALPDLCQGVRSGTNFDRLPRLASHTRQERGMVRRARVGRLMVETYSSSRDPPIAGQQPHCPKCDVRMHLARVAPGPSGFDIRTFDCAKCDHTHMVTVATDLVNDSRGLHARSIDALEEAREMPPGTPRSEALKRRVFSVELLTIRG